MFITQYENNQKAKSITIPAVKFHCANRVDTESAAVRGSRRATTKHRMYIFHCDMSRNGSRTIEIAVRKLSDDNDAIYLPKKEHNSDCS